MGFSKFQVVLLTLLVSILTNRLMPYKTLEKNTDTVVNSNSVTNLLPTIKEVVPTNSISFSQTEIILNEIKKLRKDLSSVINDVNSKINIQDSVYKGNSSLIGGMVEINSSRWEKIDVFEKKITSSKIIGEMIYGKIYFYHLKEGDWYQIYLDDGQSGWVNSQFLEEIL